MKSTGILAVVLISLVFLGCFALAFQAPPSCDSYVSVLGNDSTADGTQSKPFKTLDRAFEAIAPTIKNHTICIAGGRYAATSGSVDLNTSITINLVAFPFGPNNETTTYIVNTIFTCSSTIRIMFYGLYVETVQIKDTTVNQDAASYFESCTIKDLTTSVGTIILQNCIITAGSSISGQIIQVTDTLASNGTSVALALGKTLLFDNFYGYGTNLNISNAPNILSSCPGPYVIRNSVFSEAKQTPIIIRPSLSVNENLCNITFEFSNVTFSNNSHLNDGSALVIGISSGNTPWNIILKEILFSCNYYYNGSSSVFAPPISVDETDVDWEIMSEGISFGSPACFPMCSPGSSSWGHLLKCVACPAGEYSALPNSTECTSCAPGHFANSSGWSRCLPCPVNHYAKESGSKNCASCPENSYQPDAGQSDCEGFFLAHLNIMLVAIIGGSAVLILVIVGLVSYYLPRAGGSYTHIN